MTLADLLDLTVRDAHGRHLGYVVDVRLVLDGPVRGALRAPRLHGLLVSPRTRTSFLGYERAGARGPWPVAAFLRWRHRGTFLALWDDVAAVTSEVTLRPGYRRLEPAVSDAVGSREV